MSGPSLIPEPPLVIPFLPDGQATGALPTSPVRVAAWSTATKSGPTKRLALAGADNTVWIISSEVGAPSHLAPPDLSLSDASSPGSRPITPRSTSASSAGTVQMRARALSSTSSVLTATSLRRVLSPTGSTAAVIPTPQVSVATATPSRSDGHRHRPSASLAGRSELIQHLREQAELPVEEPAGLSLGLSGIGRRTTKEGADGAATPKSTSSCSSGRNVSMADPFTKAAEDGCAQREAKSQIEEKEVDRAMALNEAEDAREAEEARQLKAAEPRVAAATARTTPRLEGKAKDAPVRIVLPEPGRGSIVDLAVLEEVNELVVLRDVGLLDVITLSTLQLITHVSLDHAAPPTATGEVNRTPCLAPSWLWRRVHLAAREEGAMLVANGEPWPSPWPSPNGDVTRVAMLAIPSHACVANLELPGVGDVGVASNGEASYLLHCTPTSVMSYRLKFTSTPPPSGTSTPHTAPGSVTPSALHKPEPTRRGGALGGLRFSRTPTQDGSQSGLAKFLAARRIANKEDPIQKHTPAGVDEGIEVQRDGGGHWRSIRLHDNGQGVGLGDDHVEAFEFDGTRLMVRGSLAVSDGVGKDVVFASGWHDVCVATDSDTVAIYARDEPLKQRQHWTLRKTVEGHEAYLSAGVLYTVTDSAVSNYSLGSLERTTEVELIAPTAGAHICPMGADTLYVAASDGSVSKQTTSEYLHGVPPKEYSESDSGAEVTYSTIIHSEYATGGRFFAAGDEDGGLRLWDADTLRLRASMTLFDTPVRSVTLLTMGEVETLKGSLLVTSTCGSVSVVSLKELQQLFLIPAARAPLTKIYVGGDPAGGDKILLAYEIQKARVWNVETGEFRRSTGLESADDMLNSGDWAEVQFQAAPPLDSPVSKVVGPLPHRSDLGRLLQLDLRALGKWLRRRSFESSLPTLRGLLSSFLTFGINPAIDEVCTTNLGITPPSKPIAVGWEGPHATATVAFTTATGVWQVSPTTTCLRQLAIVSLLRPFLDSPEHEQWAADVIAFYAASLPEDALEADAELFAAVYLDSAFDVHQAARMLFGVRISRMSNEEIEGLVSKWQDKLPADVEPSERHSSTSARALIMLGGIALNRLEMLSPSVLKAISESVAYYLNDPDHTHVGLAIELCAKAFATWQIYVDPMDLLRRLFFLSTHNEIGANLAAQARLAVLNVASSNAPLFMSTLSMDILDAKTIEGRMSIMKLCVFMARKRPALLESGLPRIAESVVKSLDPNIGKMRDDVWEVATVILNELVEAFTTIDFHAGTQKLVVGTNEGAVIMYDLKTASRLYVLEPHKRSVSGVSFSPDGRRLVTVSLGECDSTVWKVGSSISGFFNVGGPPRQGNRAGQPYRRFPIFRAGSSPMEDRGALSDVRIEWPAARTARISINETALTYETT
ncbi:hypothetical protein CspeluHIS016_0103000 [Cutaneotrichosporon spelunceum]|uniref:WD40 repeat-like protein n=1 Tax=Cutaneotrichosporon spelunceum TaxID=1672016 RepID=A0AAD3TNF2_9TREE|nr:hypothetical protein CspeluHIS016_0103000 [Cutaneotrichosporon spelunceum]